MKIKTLVVGLFRTNTYILSKDNECIIIDPADDYNKINNYLKENNLSLKAILLTHGHFDHFGSAEALATEYNVNVYISIKDKELLVDPSKNGSDKYSRRLITLDKNVEFITKEGLLEISNFKIDVLFTPGHTKGGVCYLIDNNLFSGDTLFKNGVGRVDFYGGAATELNKSIESLLNLDENLKVYPGHGEATSIKEEKNNF